MKMTKLTTSPQGKAVICRKSIIVRLYTRFKARFSIYEADYKSLSRKLTSKEKDSSSYLPRLIIFEECQLFRVTH